MMTKISLFSFYFFALASIAQAASVSNCNVEGVVTRASFSKFDVRITYADASCEHFKGKTLSLATGKHINKNDRCLEEVEMDSSLRLGKGDEISLNYVNYNGMGPNGLVCAKKWTVESDDIQKPKETIKGY